MDPNNQQYQYQQPVAPQAPQPMQPYPNTMNENVGKGIMFALLAIPAGMLIAYLLWLAGVIASISSIAIASGAVFLYAKGAGTQPKKGIAPLIALILLGVGASFFVYVTADLSKLFDNPPVGYEAIGTKLDFIKNNIFNGDVLSSYGGDIAKFVGFAALGIVGQIIALVKSSKLK